MFQHAMFDYQRTIKKNLQLNPIKSRERVTVPESKKKVDELTSHEIHHKITMKSHETTIKTH